MSASNTFAAEGRHDDFLDWINGDDAAIERREQQRRRSIVAGAGGEVG